MFYAGTFSYTSRAGFVFIWGGSLTHPALASIFFSGKFLLHIPCFLYFYAGSFSYTSRAGFFFGGGGGVSLTHPVLAYFFYLRSFSYTSRGCFNFCGGSFSYTSRAALILCWEFRLFLFFVWGVSLTHHVLSFFLLLFFPFFPLLLLLSGDFLLHIPFRFNFYMGSFSCAEIIFMQGISQTHPVLASFLSREFLLHIPRWLEIWCREFLSHITCCLIFYTRSFSYTSRTCLIFCLGSFSYTSRAGFLFLFLLLSRKFLFYIPCWFLSFLLLFFCRGSFSYTSRASMNSYAGSFSSTYRAAWFLCG